MKARTRRKTGAGKKIGTAVTRRKPKPKTKTRKVRRDRLA